MSTRYLVVTVVETIVKIVVLAAAIVFTFRGATEAYDFGYRVFADQPMSVSGGRTITVSVEQGASVKEIADMLQEKGLIADANLFVVQELLSAYHGDIIPGIYDLGTDMKAEQMLEIMSTPAEEESEDGEGQAPEQAEGEGEDAQGQEGEGLPSDDGEEGSPESYVPPEGEDGVPAEGQ